MEHGFDIDVASKYGVKAAVIIRHLQFWIVKNRANDKHFHDGRTWTYNSAKAFAVIFPYWSERTIGRVLDSLVKRGVLLKGNYNQTPYDRTLWYAFTDESMFLSHEAISHFRKMEQKKKRNGDFKNRQPIPNPKPDMSTSSNQLGDSGLSESDLEMVVARDKAIAEGKKRLIDAVNRLLPPAGKNEATTFARISRHLVSLCEKGQREPEVFDEAIGWMKEAKMCGKKPKALFVAMVKERTGFKAQNRLLTTKRR